MTTEFTLVVATSADGFIARHSGDSPASWASPEEQAHFFRLVGDACWSVMGRKTHEVADRPDRRRIIFSGQVTTPEWRRPTQVWVNPDHLRPEDLPALVNAVTPMTNPLILGGTLVHDWFHAHAAIARIELTVEPVSFGLGLPVFSGDGPTDPLTLFGRRGYGVAGDRILNQVGTRLITLEPAPAQPA